LELHGSADPGIATFEGAPLVLGQPTKHSSLLAEVDGPFQASINDLAATAYGFGFLYLEVRWAGVPDGEEQVRVLVQAGSAVAPSHQIGLLEAGVWESATLLLLGCEPVDIDAAS
jgi:hypothetical protein